VSCRKVRLQLLRPRVAGEGVVVSRQILQHGGAVDDRLPYAEQPAGEGSPIVSGKFRSMLIDIFGRTYPEKEFFQVDRDAVVRYKTRVHRNVARVGTKLQSILRNVAKPA
jgi:hypothetical protein